MKITLAKALKLKNKRINELNKTKYKVIRSNSYNVNNKPTYNSEEELIKYINQTESLLKLKEAINKANIGIFPSIMKMDELKNQISILKELSVKSGEYNEREYGEASKTLTYEATISERKRDEMVNKLEEEIETIQDQIDHFNATTEIEI